MRHTISAIAIFLAGFGIAWWLKPNATSANTAATPPRPAKTRIERPARHATAKPATDAFFQRVKEVEGVEDKHRAIIDEVTAEQIPELLAELQSRTGMRIPDYSNWKLIEELVMAWHAKAPDDAVAWVAALKNKHDRKELLEKIATLMAATDLDAALRLMNQHPTPWGVSFLMETAVSQGEDQLVKVCKQTIGSTAPTPKRLSYPADFGFQRTLEGLAAAQAAAGENGQNGVVPGNLLREWAERDSHAAWAWLQQGKKVTFNGTLEFLQGYATVGKPDEVGSLLASIFDPTSIPDDRYMTTLRVLNGESPEMLDSFLQAAPGDRTAHLNGLLDQSTPYSEGSNIHKIRAMILERMDPAMRVQALRRNYSERGADGETRHELVPTLMKLGHSEEEIQSLLSPRKK